MKINQLAKISLNDFIYLVAHSYFEFDQDIELATNFSNWKILWLKFFGVHGRLRTINDFVNNFDLEDDQDIARSIFQNMRVYCHDEIYAREEELIGNKKKRFRESEDL